MPLFPVLLINCNSVFRSSILSLNGLCLNCVSECFVHLKTGLPMSNRDVTETSARAVWWQLWETRHPYIPAALPDMPKDKGSLAEGQAKGSRHRWARLLAKLCCKSKSEPPPKKAQRANKRKREAKGTEILAAAHETWSKQAWMRIQFLISPRGKKLRKYS